MVVLSVPSEMDTEADTETGELAFSTRGFGVGVSWLVVVIVLVSTTVSAAALVVVVVVATVDGGMEVVSVEIGISPPVSTKQ